MITLIVAAAVAAQPAPPADMAGMHHGQQEAKKDCCKDCCKDMAKHEGHGADEHAGHQQ